MRIDVNNSFSYQERRHRRNQRRAQSFSTREQFSRFIETIDVNGNSTFVEEESRLSGVDHAAVLSALSNRASQFRSSLSNNNISLLRQQQQQQQQLRTLPVDETGTAPILERLSATTSRQSEVNRREIQVRERLETSRIDDETLRIHGTAPGTKQEGVFRLLYENANGIDNRQLDGYKVSKARELHHRLEADLVAYNEHRLNLRHPANKIGFNQLFNGGETEIRSVVAHNIHECLDQERVQEGGTAMLLFGPLIQQLSQNGCIKDEVGLGRWVVMTLQGNEGFRTRFVCGYNPCGSSRLDSGTVYAQHKRFFRLHQGSNVCPRIKFREDLLALLTLWRNQGDRIVVCLDANEHIYKKALGKALTSPEGLNMKEVVGSFTGKPIGGTFSRGTKPIDAIWATSDVTVVSACIMPAGYIRNSHMVDRWDIQYQQIMPRC